MRKVVTLFVFSLVAFIDILIGDAIDKSEYIIKTNDDLLNKTVQTAQTVEKYFSIAEWLTGLTALVSGIVTLGKKTKVLVTEFARCPLLPSVEQL